MEIGFPSDIEDINETDFDVLLALHLHGDLWKMEITRKINSRRSEDTLIDMKESISKQAVAKRVERLFELGYIDTSIISFKKVKGPNNGSLIRGYQLNEKGLDVLEESTVKILRDVVSRSIESGETFRNTGLYLKVYNDLKDLEAETLLDFVAEQLDCE